MEEVEEEMDEEEVDASLFVPNLFLQKRMDNRNNLERCRSLCNFKAKYMWRTQKFLVCSFFHLFHEFSCFSSSFVQMPR